MRDVYEYSSIIGDEHIGDVKLLMIFDFLKFC